MGNLDGVDRQLAMIDWAKTFGAPLGKRPPCPENILKEVSRRSGISEYCLREGLIFGS